MSHFPSTWIEVDLPDAVFFQEGPGLRKFQYRESGVPFVNIRTFVNGSIDGSLCRFLDPQEVQQKYQHFLVQANDILVATSGSIGKWAIAKEGDLPLLLNTSIVRFRPHSEDTLDRGYLLWFLRSPLFTDQAWAASTGSAQANVGPTHLKKFHLPIPPLLEQRRIVAKLNRLSERSSAARDHLIRVSTLATRAKQAILASAFRGQLTSEWRSSKDFQKIGKEMVEDSREQRRAWWISEEQRKREAKGQSTNPGAWTKKYRAPEEISAEGTIFDVPKSWAWIASEEAVAPGAEIVYGIVQPGPKLDEGIPYVRGMDIVDGVIQIHQLLRTSPEIALKYARASLEEGDILLGIIRATKVAIVPKEISGANITQGTARFRPSNSIRTKFLARWLEGPDAQKWLHSKYRGIDMPGLNLRDVRRCPVPLAPIEEQDEIIRRIETAFARIDRLTEEAGRASHLLDRLDERLLAKAFQGELVRQDPNDEPAEALLERIREARDAAPKPKRARRKKTA